MIQYKSPREIKLMREAGKLVAGSLELVKKMVRPGIKTMDLDRTVEKYVLARRGELAFKGYRGYPGNICVSINEEVVHGIPDENRVLKEGDIVSIDVGVKYKNYYGDAALTLPVGRISAAAQKLLTVTETVLAKAIDHMAPEVKLSDVSAVIQNFVEKNGFSVVRSFVGHGIGSTMHEEPQVPNYVMPPGEGAEVILKPGLVLALEPMVNTGTSDVEVLGNSWTVVTKDRKLSAHFEHTAAVTGNGSEILTRPA